MVVLRRVARRRVKSKVGVGGQVELRSEVACLQQKQNLL